MGQIDTSNRLSLTHLSILAAAIFAFLLCGCAGPKIPDDVRYEVIDRREQLGGIMNLNLWVRLNKRVPADVLRSIAAKLKSSEPRQYNQIFIFYYLPWMPNLPGKRHPYYAWAHSHFTPDLEVKISGLSLAEYGSLSIPEVQPGQSVVGVWLDSLSRITIYQESGHLYLNTKYKDGSGRTEEVTSTDTPRGRTFQTSKMTRDGEYFLVNGSRNLEIWDKDGPGDTAESIKQ